MKRLFSGLNLVLVGWLCFCGAMAEAESRRDHKVYDFHYDIRYPGHLRSDVSLDQVTEPNAKDLKSYNRREVTWWPKRGVDYTPLEDIPGAPKRTWTPRIPKDSWTGAYLDNFPKEPFEAHLVNFRGIGDDSLQDLDDPDSFHCPAAVLRFSDGSKRVILAKYLSPEDRKYLMDVYLADRERMDKTLLQDEYEVPLGAQGFPEGEDELYKMGQIRFDTKHACIVIPSNAPPDGNSWVRKEDHEKVMQTIAHLKNQMEAYWAYHEYAGGLMRYWERPNLYKYVPQFGHGGGGGGGGYVGCTLGGPDITGLFHEFGHGMHRGGMLSLGGGETSCDSLQIMGNPANIHKAEHQVNRPWKNLFHGAYPGGGGYEIIADDPNWGYAIAATTSYLASDEDQTPMQIYAHLGEERGLWKEGEGIRGVGDLMGQVGARFAEFDCQQEFQFRQSFASPNRSYLVPVDVEKGVYRCPANEAPEPFGVSISRLIPEAGAKSITVDFLGDFDPETYSDWRACIVAVGEDGACRYSPLWNKGVMKMDLNEGDRRFWLTVTATPKALLDGGWIVYQGGFTYKYPYQVTLQGCRPGSPFGTLADNNNTALAAPNWIEGAIFGSGNRAYVLDLPPVLNEAEKEVFTEQMQKNIAESNRLKEASEQKLASFGPEPGGYERWYYGRSIRMTGAAAYRAQLLLDDLGGAPHPNGGGWVSATSHADPTAYVGPNCYVLDGGKVLDHAQLIDGAVVIGEGAVVKDHAKLSHKAAVVGLVEVNGFARVYGAELNRPRPSAETTNIETKMVSGIPQRGFEEAAGGLMANYEVLRPETVLFEDLMRKRSTDAFFSGYHLEPIQIFYDGRLVGAPGFEEADGNGAVVFNGKDQYAELAPEVADLAEIMIDLRVKLASTRTPQTLFDFGANLDSRFVLELDKRGRPTLSWTLDGETRNIKTSERLQADAWTDLRVEIDGSSVVLYVNNEQVAERESEFRPAYVFDPAFARRNFVFRSRSEKKPNYTSGQLDYLRIYSAVPEDYQALPAVPFISPTKAVPEVLAKMTEDYGDHAYMLETYKEDLVSHSEDFNKARTWNDRLLLRKYTYELGSDPETIKESLAVRDHYYELEAELSIKKHHLYNEYMQSEEVLAAKERIEEMQNQLESAKKDVAEKTAALEEEFKSVDTPETKEFLAKKAEYEAKLDRWREDEQQYNNRARAIEEETRAKLEDKLAELNRQIAELTQLLSQREKELTEEVGPVAKAFAAAIAEAGNEADRRDLIRRREGVLRYHPSWKNPPTGLLYRDLKAVELRARLQELEGRAKALEVDALMDNPEYIEAKTRFWAARRQRERLDKNPIPLPYQDKIDALPSKALLESLNTSIRDASNFNARFEGYALNKIGDLPLRVAEANEAWEKRCIENSVPGNADEMRFVQSTDYIRRFISINVRHLKQAIAEHYVGEGPIDDMEQLATAVQEQQQWLTSTADWDTEHRQEKGYENRNDIIKRWLKRVKPQKYARGE